jgi:hypothetical protein
VLPDTGGDPGGNGSIAASLVAIGIGVLATGAILVLIAKRRVR